MTLASRQLTNIVAEILIDDGLVIAERMDSSLWVSVPGAYSIVVLYIYIDHIILTTSPAWCATGNYELDNPNCFEQLSTAIKSAIKSNKYPILRSHL